jgi:DNA replication and repair protein RecF
LIDEIRLINFRNYDDRTFQLGRQTVITGPNGAGKTNILEAVAMLSLTTSWKTDKDSEVVRWGESFCRVVAGERELVIQAHPYFKRIRIDGISKRVGEVVGTLPTVLFQPDDSALIYGSPTYRRQAIDRLLSQTVPGYLKALTQMQKVLKQRNKLLKMIQEGQATEGELSYWDEELARDAGSIDAARSEAMPVLEERIRESFHEMIDSTDEVTVMYERSPRHIEGGSFVEHLRLNRFKEIAAGSTLYGPHREDLIFKWGEHGATEGMSRGQVRALVLAFKLAELKYIEEKTDKAPILLLDDVFSEFDDRRRQKVTELSQSYQTVLTTTDTEGIEFASDSVTIALL